VILLVVQEGFPDVAACDDQDENPDSLRRC